MKAVRTMCRPMVGCDGCSAVCSRAARTRGGSDRGHARPRAQLRGRPGGGGFEGVQRHPGAAAAGPGARTQAAMRDRPPSRTTQGAAPPLSWFQRASREFQAADGDARRRAAAVAVVGPRGGCGEEGCRRHAEASQGRRLASPSRQPRPLRHRRRMPRSWPKSAAWRKHAAPRRRRAKTKPKTDAAKRAADAKAAEEAKKAADAKAAEAKRAADAKAAEEAKKAAEAKRVADAKAAEEAKKAADAKAAESQAGRGCQGCRGSQEGRRSEAGSRREGCRGSQEGGGRQELLKPSGPRMPRLLRPSGRRRQGRGRRQESRGGETSGRR